MEGNSADVREEVDKIVTRLHEIVQPFGGFCGRIYLGEYGRAVLVRVMAFFNEHGASSLNWEYLLCHESETTWLWPQVSVAWAKGDPT